MPLEKQPFRSYTLDNDKKDPFDVGKVFTVRLNAEEYKQLKQAMLIFNLRNESTTLKLLAQIGENVILNTFGAKKLRWLFRGDRAKLED